ncbi:MAG: hypothetical protein ACPGUV_12605, partial [Polyangiales bacterium]
MGSRSSCAAQAADAVSALTGHAIGPSRNKRVFAAAADELQRGHADCFAAHYAHPEVPESANTAVISVDALSLRLRHEGFKQATVATVTLLDAAGSPVLWGWPGSTERTHTLRIAEMPQAGKRDIMERVEQEVQALLAAKPELSLQVVIDGAPDLRNHLQERFPQALHLTDLYHVLEHLGDALRHLFADDDARRLREKVRWAHKLKHIPGSDRRLVRWLRAYARRSDDPLLSYARREVDKHVEYIHRQGAFLDYPKALAERASLGSGRVEAACKTLVTQRLKVSGASWSRAGGAAVLFVREGDAELGAALLV